MDDYFDDTPPTSEEEFFGGANTMEIYDGDVTSQTTSLQPSQLLEPIGTMSSDIGQSIMDDEHSNSTSFEPEDNLMQVQEQVTPITTADEVIVKTEPSIIQAPMQQIVEEINSNQEEEQIVEEVKTPKKRGRKRRKTSSKDDYVEVPKAPKTKQVTPPRRKVVTPTTPPSPHQDMPMMEDEEENNNQDETAGTDLLKLNREQLLNLSSKAFEEYAQKLMESKELSNEEKKELKRQRRLIKNRESAQLSRQRKKSYIEKLEQKVQLLTTTNATYKEQITALQSQNNTLKEEVVQLQNIIKKTPGLAQLFNTGVTYAANLAKQNHSQNLANNAKMAGVCLMILLFSFGLFLPQLQGQSSPLSLGGGNNGGVSTTQPALTMGNEVIPQHARLFKGPQQGHLELASSSSSSASSSQVATTSTDFNMRRIQSQQEMRISNGQRISSPIQVGSGVNVNATNVPNLQRQQPQQPDIKSWQANTTYLVCKDVAQMTPPQPTERVENEPSLLKFLIPADNLGGPSSDFIEITCNVLDANLIPALVGQRQEIASGSVR